MCEQFFSDDYHQARDKFLQAAHRSGCFTEKYAAPFKDPEGRDLFIDVAICGPGDAENALVLMCGTHGIEGFAGSAIQYGLLTCNALHPLPPGVKIVMIHALNPFGFAYLRRFNEDNVDLNRNFVDHSLTYPENPEYDRLVNLIEPEKFTAIDNFFTMLKISRLLLCSGIRELQSAVTYGQYNHPHGLFYGGRKATWSNIILHDIVGRFLGIVARATIIDFHTGLGPYAVGEIILNDSAGEPAYQRACAWWGAENVKSTVSGESVSADLSGTVKLAFDRMMPDTEVTGVGLEFGTLPPLKVFWALRAENWLYHHGGQNHPAAVRIKEQLRKAFYPDDPEWRKSVWAQGRQVTEQAMNVFKEL